MAIHSALHTQEVRGVQAFMTDSLNSIRLIAAQIGHPETLRYHKHCQLISEIAETLLAWPNPISLVKVRSHSSVSRQTPWRRQHTVSARLSIPFVNSGTGKSMGAGAK